MNPVEDVLRHPDMFLKWESVFDITIKLLVITLNRWVSFESETAFGLVTVVRDRSVIVFEQ